MFEQREVKEENDIIRAKALPGTKKKEPANLPNEFITNDDFCPGCGLELKSLPTERTQLWTDVFQRDLDRRRSTRRNAEQHQAGPAAFPRLGRSSGGWAPTAARYVEALRKDIEALRKALPPKYAYVHGVARRREAGRPARSHMRGNPMQPRRRGAARASSSVLSPTASRRRSPRAAAGSSWPTPSPRSRSRCA